MKCLLQVLVLTLVTYVECKKKILSFGGNGNIGSEVLARLIETEEYDITLVSRGNWHFDSAVRIMPKVSQVICDRGKEAECAAEDKNCDINTLRNCTDLMEVIEKTDEFHAVLDFSGYEAKWIHDATSVLKDKVRVYVYVSTDSVYEVSEAKGSQRKTKEQDAKRPTDLEKRKELVASDRYGDAKLAGEEALQTNRENGGFPWVALRFADVVGPRDTTYRWFLYQIWVKFYNKIDIPLHVPPHVQNVRSSLTYVNDAAQSVILAMEKGPEAWDQAYNIAFEEDFNLEEILTKMAEIMDVKDLKIDHDNSDRSFHLYPTVFSGAIDISLAKEKLDFVPTSVDQAFKDTIAWYDSIFISMEGDREEVISRLVTYVIPRNKKDLLYVAVEEELEKHGVVDKRYRKKKKGDVGDHQEL